MSKPIPAQPCAGPNFLLVLANVLSVKTAKPLFKPYVVLERTLKVTTADGKPTRRSRWASSLYPAEDSRLGRSAGSMAYSIPTASRSLPTVHPGDEGAGADLIVAISHGGLDANPSTPSMENANWHLAQVKDVDAMLIGHSHQTFPNAASTMNQFNLPNVDKAKRLRAWRAHRDGKFLGQDAGRHPVATGREDGRWSVDKRRRWLKPATSRTPTAALSRRCPWWPRPFAPNIRPLSTT